MKAHRFRDEGMIHKGSRQRGVLSSYQAEITNGDFALERVSGNGQKFVELSTDPLSDDHQSILMYEMAVRAPFSVAVPMSISQRAKNSYFSLEAVDDDTQFVNDRTPIAIASISQATTTLTVVLSAPCDLQRDEQFHIYGLNDNRLNYSNVTVLTLSADRKTITATVADDATIPSVTIGAVTNSGYIIEAISSINNENGMAFRFSGSSATAAALIVRGSGSKPRKSGTVGGVDTVTVASTAAVISNGGNAQFEIKPTSAYEFIFERGQVSFEDYGVDQATAQSTVRGFFDTVSPDMNPQYYARLRSTSPKSMSRPIAKIVSAQKSGSSTVTITTAVDHGLVIGSIVDVHGVRDQTNFANSTALSVVSTPTSKTFTVVLGSSATAISYGGMVVMRNGGADMSGRAGQSIQSVAIDADGIVTVVGSGTWSGITVGEFVTLYGVRNAVNGGDMLLDGSYLLIDLATTTIKLIAIKGLDGEIVKDGDGMNVTPALPITTTTNCGGSVIMRTTARVHDLKLSQYNLGMVKIWGQGESRTDMAIPVTIQNTATTTANEGTPQTPSASALTTAATTNATSVKTTAGNVYSIEVSNTTATQFFLKLYNKASAPTVGTDIPIATIPIPASSFQQFEFGRMGKRFTTGIAFAVTAGIAATDTAAVLAGSYVNINYQ